MPVTAKLSRLFYERLGEQVTNELVDWFNAVDATYRGDLRELNELNFARFDAKMEQRFAESEAKIERRFIALEGKFEQRFIQIEAKIDTVAADLRTTFERALKDQVRWLYLTWGTLLLTIIGLWTRR